MARSKRSTELKQSDIGSVWAPIKGEPHQTVTISDVVMINRVWHVFFVDRMGDRHSMSTLAFLSSRARVADPPVESMEPPPDTARQDP